LKLQFENGSFWKWAVPTQNPVRNKISGNQEEGNKGERGGNNWEGKIQDMRGENQRNEGRYERRADIWEGKIKDKRGENPRDD